MQNNKELKKSIKSSNPIGYGQVIWKSQFTEETKVANKHMKRFSIPPVNREIHIIKTVVDFPFGPVVKNLTYSAGWGTKILQATEQVSLNTTTRGSKHHKERSYMMQQRFCVPQLIPKAVK